MVWYFIYFFKMLLFWLDRDCRMVHFLQTVEDIINKVAQTQRYHYDDSTRTMSCNQIEAGSMQHIIFVMFLSIIRHTTYFTEYLVVQIKFVS